MSTFCLLHGNWHDGSCWDPLIVRLRARGHRAVAPDLPFDDARATYEDRARPALDALEGLDGPIVVVGHSVASAEAALVSAKTQPALLVYLCSRFGSYPVPPDAPAIFRAGFPFPAKDDAGRMVWEPRAAIGAMYSRLEPVVGRELAKRLRPGAAPVGDYPLADHPDVPTALIYAADDEFFEPAWERYVAQELLHIEPIEIPGGHFPMLEDSDGLADLLNSLATASQHQR